MNARTSRLVFRQHARAPQRLWTPDQAHEWRDRLPQLVGANYVPADAGGPLGMWQAHCFNPARIDLELGWAEDIGMNTMRVFLHDLLWHHDKDGFERRINQFLDIAAERRIKPMFVLFDSCWHPAPRLGEEGDPIEGVHNSLWTQSPGAEALSDRAQYPRLLRYVEDVIARWGDDDRVLAFDMFNEPDNNSMGVYKGFRELTRREKDGRILDFLPQAFMRARTQNPTRPLTSGVWHGDWSAKERMHPLHRLQIELSDVISFHNYGDPEKFKLCIEDLEKYGRPVLCTETVARPLNCTIEGNLPVALDHRTGFYMWGFVRGKSQTWIPWDSRDNPYVNRSPARWFHDLFHGPEPYSPKGWDGHPYRVVEIDFYKKALQNNPRFARPPRRNPPDLDHLAAVA